MGPPSGSTLVEGGGVNGRGFGSGKGPRKLNLEEISY